ncbi:MAG: helix-turn-helix domain-containing protein [Microbacterium sp.]
MLISVTTRPQASLGRVLDDLGATFLELLVGSPTHAERPAHLGGIAIHDPIDEPLLPQNALVLGVGLSEPDQIIALLRSLGEHGVAGLVVRAPIDLTDEIRSAVADSGVSLLGLMRGASWSRLSAMLNSLLADDDVGSDGADTLGGMPLGDLFALANAVAALLDAPVTIEDRNSRVVAFSAGQDAADESRVTTVLGRQVPEVYLRLLAKMGVFQHLNRSDEPIFIDPVVSDENEVALPRVAVAVRAGDELLGSIWAVVPEPLNEERTTALRDAARIVALHMLRNRAGADVEGRLRADLVSTALEGGAGAREALTRLGMADQPVIVLALAMLHSDELSVAASGAALATERQRLAAGLGMHLSAAYSRSAAALLGDVVYGIVPASRESDDGEGHAVRVARDFLERVGERVPAVIAVGSVVDSASELSRARASADRALRVLRTGISRRVARPADVQVESLLLELRDLVEARGDQPTGAVARLIEYDEQHRGALVDTLRAWLDAFGDVNAAASGVHVHPNTFRYRLRRLAEVGGIDLADPESRFTAMLQLRVITPTSPA